MRSGAVQVYDGTNGEPLANVAALARPERFEGVDSTAPLAFLPNGNLVIGSMAGPLRIVNPADGTEVARIESPPLTTNNFLWLTKDATHAVTLGHSSWEGDWDTPISTFDLEAGRRVEPEPTPMHTNCNQSATPSRSGRSCAPRGVDVSSPRTSPPGPRSTECSIRNRGPYAAWRSLPTPRGSSSSPPVSIVRPPSPSGGSTEGARSAASSLTRQRPIPAPPSASAIAVTTAHSSSSSQRA